jgi:hypothetical protein
VKRRAALALVLLLGAWLRARHVSEAFLFGDELHSLPVLDLPWRRVLAAFDLEGSGLALPLLQKLSVSALGSSLLALRLPALLPALLALVLLPVLGRRVVSAEGALIATALAAASPFLVFYARFARSYSLVLLLALVFTWAAVRVADRSASPRLGCVALALCGGLLPWAHLTSAGFVAVTAAAALLAVSLQPQAGKRLRAVLAACLGAAALAAALHLPAAARAAAVVARKQDERYESAFSPLDVVALLAGGHAVGALLAAATLVAAVVRLRAVGPRALPLAAAALLPVPLVFAGQPYGDPYAYARYAIAALPAALLLLGELGAAGLRRVPAAERALPVLAPALAVLGACAGPLGARDDGRHANTYLALLPLPAFDAPFPAVPAAYDRIEDGAVIVETPALVNRSRQLYRAYYLRHRRPTLLGFLPEEGPAPPGPHVSLLEPRLLAGRADYLVVHRDPELEVSRYWRFVYEEAWPRTGGPRALMERQADWGRPLARPSPELVERLRRRFGPPVVENEELLVFRLR